MKKLYKYLGKLENKTRSQIASNREIVRKPEDVLNWLKKNKYKIAENKTITTTFILNLHLLK